MKKQKNEVTKMKRTEHKYQKVNLAYFQKEMCKFAILNLIYFTYDR